MDGLQIVLIIIAVLVIIFNFFINFANIIRIVRYCFATNTLDQYWTAFFKSGLSLRAIFSSIIGIILALFVFIIITPIILIRRARGGVVRSGGMAKNMFISYEETYPVTEGEKFKTNVSELGVEIEEVEITGALRMDAIITLSEIDKACKDKELDSEFKVMDELELNNKEKTTIPVVFYINGESYPIYFLYTQDHIVKFKKAREVLAASGVRKCIYFSIEHIN